GLDSIILPSLLCHNSVTWLKVGFVDDQNIVITTTVFICISEYIPYLRFHSYLIKAKDENNRNRTIKNNFQRAEPKKASLAAREARRRIHHSFSFLLLHLVHGLDCFKSV